MKVVTILLAGAETETPEETYERLRPYIWSVALGRKSLGHFKRIEKREEKQKMWRFIESTPWMFNPVIFNLPDDLALDLLLFDASDQRSSFVDKDGRSGSEAAMAVYRWYRKKYGKGAWTRKVGKLFSGSTIDR